MKNLAAIAAGLRKNISNQTNVNALPLRSTRTSEISSFVKNVNISETLVLKKELDIWHKDTNFELRKLHRKQDDMYRALLRLSKAKKEIKTVRKETQRDKEEENEWKRSKRRPKRRSDITGSNDELLLQETNDAITAVAEVNCLKIFHDNSPLQDPSNDIQPLKPVITGVNKFKAKSQDFLQLPVVQQPLPFLSTNHSKENDTFQEEVVRSDNCLNSINGVEQENKTKAEKIDEPFEFPDNLRIIATQSESSNRIQNLEKKTQTINDSSAASLESHTEEENLQALESLNSSPLPGLSLKPAYLKPSPTSTLFGKSQRLSSRHLSMDLNKSKKEIKDKNDMKVGEKVDDKLNIERAEESEIAEKDLQNNFSKIDPRYSNPVFETNADKEGQGCICTECQTNADDVGSKLLPVLMTPTENYVKKRKRKRPRYKMKKTKMDPSEELNQRSSLQPRPGVVYNVTLYKKNGEGNLEEEEASYDTTVDVAKYFNLASHRERLHRKKLLDDAHHKEAQQRHRVNSFISKLNRELELKNEEVNQRRKKAEEAKLALQRRLEAIRRGPPKYGSTNQLEAPNYVRKYVKPSSLKDQQERKSFTRKRSSWSVPSIFTLQIASSRVTPFNSFNSGGGGGGITPAIIPEPSSSHLVNINIEKYVLDAQDG